MWLISAFHPFRLLNSVCFYSNIILVPVGYIKIFKYRKSLDSHVSGLTERARNLRKIRNLVNFKFNMFAWILDMASILLVIASSDFQILYLLVTSCGPLFSGYGGEQKSYQKLLHILHKVVEISF